MEAVMVVAVVMALMGMAVMRAAKEVWEMVGVGTVGAMALRATVAVAVWMLVWVLVVAATATARDAAAGERGRVAPGPARTR